MEWTGKGRIASRGAQAVALAGSESAGVNRNYLSMVRRCRRRAMCRMIEMMKRCVNGVGDQVVEG